MKIDVHCHILPQSWPDLTKVCDGLRRSALIRSEIGFELLEKMNRSGQSEARRAENRGPQKTESVNVVHPHQLRVFDGVP